MAVDAELSQAVADENQPGRANSAEPKAAAAAERVEPTSRTSAEGRPETLPAAPRGVSILLGPRSAEQHADQAGEVDRVRFVQRVARAFRAVGDDGGQIRLRLSPPELGSLRLEVSIRAGVLSAHVEAETQQARALLLESLPALRERLGEQNIKLERFEVDLMNQSPGDGGGPFTGPGDDLPRREPPPARAAGNAPPDRPAGVNRQRPDGGSQLNVVV
jgi:flagellar hook-length control protein FliK